MSPVDKSDIEKARIAAMQALPASEIETMRALGFEAQEDRFRNDRDVMVRWSASYRVWRADSDAWSDYADGATPTRAVEAAWEEAEDLVARGRSMLAALAPPFGPAAPVSPTHAPIALGVEEGHPPSEHEVSR